MSAGEATDSFTRTGAERLARTIRDYWAARGYKVRTNVLPLHTAASGFDNAFVVKSDLVNGKPRAAKIGLDRGSFVTTSRNMVPHALEVYRL